jgi:hypothetical protein
MWKHSGQTGEKQLIYGKISPCALAEYLTHNPKILCLYLNGRGERENHKEITETTFKNFLGYNLRLLIIS